MHPLQRNRRLPRLVHPALAATLVVSALACGGADRATAPALGPLASVVDVPGPHGKLVFHSTRDGNTNFNVYVMNADGTDQTRITSDDNNDIDPTWSPNGQLIAVNRFAPDFSGCEVYVMNADGTGIRRLTTGGGYEFGGIWSPDGKQIAFTSNRDGADDIYLINVDGTGLRRLTTNAYVGGVTAWSPNGKQIAYVGYRDFVIGPFGDQEIYAVDVADGTTITQLTDNYYDDEGDRAGWSPNGKLFAFSSRRDGYDLDIFVMNADGTDVRQLTGVGGDYVDDDDPFWSPDGKYLSFQSSRDGNEEVYTMRADGSDVRRLTFQPDGFDAVATWTGGRIQAP